MKPSRPWPARTQLAQHLDQAEPALVAQAAQWTQAARRDALEALRFSDDACPIRLEEPSEWSARSYVESGSMDNTFGSWTLREVPAGEEPGACACERDLQTLRTTRADLNGQPEKLTRWTLQWAGGLTGGRRGYEVVFLVDSLKEPVAGSDTFVPGLISGRAVLFDGARPICGGEVAAQSSTNVATSYMAIQGSVLSELHEGRAAMTSALRRDLEVQLRRAVVGALSTLKATEPAASR